jgi:2-methylisocitrate lyase-like PEP mutase family enzyme
LLAKDDIALGTKEVAKPLSVNMGFGIRARPTTPLLSAKEMQDLGVAVASCPRLVTSAAIMGMRNAPTGLQQSVAEETVIERPDLAVSFAKINELMGFGTIREMEQRFLAAQQLDAEYGAKRWCNDAPCFRRECRLRSVRH